MNNVYITGENLILRTLNTDDYLSYKEVRERCQSWLVPWEPTVDGVPMDTTSTFNHFNHRIQAFQRGGQFDTSYGWGILLHDGTLIGEISLGSILRGPFQSAMMGYWLDKKFAGRGLMPEAVSLSLDYAFSMLGFRRIEIAILPRNLSSIRVVEKLGFSYEGISKEYIEVAGIREDHKRYSMTPGMWRDRNNQI